MTTCECGLTYMPGIPEDDERHAREHAEYLSGPALLEINQVNEVASVGQLSVHLLDGSYPLPLRRRLAYVAMVAHRCMSSYPTGYDGTVTEDDQRLYLVADRDNVVAMALTSLDERFWKLAWGPKDSFVLVDKSASLRRGHKIARLWTAASYRGKGIARSLALEVARLLPCELSMLGWELPFTAAGARMVQHFLPHSFWGCADRFTLRQVLRADAA